jgi:hypothetical protein
MFNSKKDKENLDQFYTNPLTAKKITGIFIEKLKELNYQKITFRVFSRHWKLLPSNKRTYSNNV